MQADGFWCGQNLRGSFVDDREDGADRFVPVDDLVHTLLEREDVEWTSQPHADGNVEGSETRFQGMDEPELLLREGEWRWTIRPASRDLFFARQLHTFFAQHGLEQRSPFVGRVKV